MNLKILEEASDLRDKTVLLRIDTDVDINNGIIIDDTRLKVSLPTIFYILEHGGKVILIGHLGRPKSIQNSEIRNQKSQEFSLLPVAKWFEQKLKGKLEQKNIEDFTGWEITDSVSFLENIRFYDGEKKNTSEFAKLLASLGNLYVNDAFAVSHRSHASLVAITDFLPHYAGIHLQKEIKELGNILKNPKRPLVVLIGGAKIETKLPMVETMHKVADYVLVGGEIAEQDKVLIKVQHEKIEGKKSVVLVADVKENKNDITDKSVENFIQILNLAATIVWNGPVGLIRSNIKNEISNTEDNTEKGTRMLAEAISQTTAYKVVGGGDTLAYLRKLNLLDKFDFVSTGGGAMLEFLSGKELPGIKPLMDLP